ncbi:hypothetical protein CampHawk_191 [Bacillus phage CampHawk]|uniref:Uncharacterized protein n=1 Tax=Bacillus phage CampHawk TaxID=1406783 RepID=U5PT81_9CAUD|nr:hypothetical protein CampHawk_191 [Bacillus phage CampHawk]AGY47069.1 hypothetical protein CampHawk_191 [Bacillus phage CampHawk]
MKVKDLIKELSEFDPEAIVTVSVGEEVPLADFKVTEGYDDQVHIGD